MKKKGKQAATQKEARKETVAAVRPAPAAVSPQQDNAPLEPSLTIQPPEPGGEDRRDRGAPLKAFAVLALFVAALLLAYYLLGISGSAFDTGSEVDAETFKGIFLNATNVYIVMDVRGAGNDVISNNVIQCGVDFASSSGMGGKLVTPISLSDAGCVTPDGTPTVRECFSMLRDGITVYVKEGPGGAKYYAKGMVVTVGQQYALGTCGIKRY
jgi:hypothetical protein